MDDYVDKYTKERQSKGIFRLIASLLLLLGGIIGASVLALLDTDNTIAVYGCVGLNLIGAFGIVVFILEDREYVFPYHRSS